MQQQKKMDPVPEDWVVFLAAMGNDDLEDFIQNNEEIVSPIEYGKYLEAAVKVLSERLFSKEAGR